MASSLVGMNSSLQHGMEVIPSISKRLATWRLQFNSKKSKSNNSNRSLRTPEEELVGGVVEAADLEHADLHVHREGVEAHGADEGDPAGHRVQQVVVHVHPEALQLGQDQVRLEGLQIP